MGLSDIVRSAVAVADGVTASLQVPVTHYSYSAATVDDSGKVTWGTGVVRMAVVSHTRRQLRDKDGRDIVSSTQIIFPRPVAISPLDRFTLPDGSSYSPIGSATEGVVDPSTSGGYYREVML